MKYVIALLFGLFILSTNTAVYAQDSLSHKTTFPKGITLEYGTGQYAVTDEYISKEKYSGPLPYYRVGWAKCHEKYVYQLGIEYRNSSEIKNYNVRTDIYQFSLNQGFLYPLPKFTLFKKDVYPFLGPTTDLFFYFNEQNIAVSGFDYTQSFAALLSLGIQGKLFYRIGSTWTVEGALGFSVLSVGFRMVDYEETDMAPVKPLTVFSGVNAAVRLGLRYYVFNNLSLKASYCFNMTRISSWDPLLSASDTIIFSVTYGF